MNRISCQKIKKVERHPHIAIFEVVHILDKQLTVKKGDFFPGNLCIYIEDETTVYPLNIINDEYPPCYVRSYSSYTEDIEEKIIIKNKEYILTEDIDLTDILKNNREKNNEKIHDDFMSGIFICRL